MRLIYGGGVFYWMGYEISCVLSKVRGGYIYGFYCANHMIMKEDGVS